MNSRRRDRKGWEGYSNKKTWRDWPPPPAHDLPLEMLHKWLLRHLRPPILFPSSSRRVASKQHIFQCFVQVHVYGLSSGTHTIFPMRLSWQSGSFWAIQLLFPLLHFMLLLQAAPLALPSAALSWPGVFSLPTPQLLLSQSLQALATVWKHVLRTSEVFTPFCQKANLWRVWRTTHTVQRQGISHIIKEWTAATKSWNTIWKLCYLRGWIAHCC